MAIGNVPGDLVASLVLDSVSLSTEPGSIGVAVSSVVADGPSAVRVTLSAPADIAGTIAIAEVDSGASPFVATCEPTGAPNEWRISWAPVGGGGGITNVIANLPLSASVALPNAFLQIVPGINPGEVLTWNGSQWVAALPAPPAVPWKVVLSLGLEHTNSTPAIVGGVYIDGPRTLAASCTALFSNPSPGGTGFYRGLLSMVDLTGANVATWDTGNVPAGTSIGALLGGATLVPGGWYTLRLAATLGGGAVQACGLQLTE